MARGGYLGYKDVIKDMWPSSTEKAGIFLNAARSTAPTTRPDSSSLQEGDFYYNSTDDVFYVYNGSSFVTVGAASAASTGVHKAVTVTLTNTNMLNLRATPITIIAAPGAGIINIPLYGCMIFNRTAAYTETADNMALRYTNGSGTICSGTIEATGFVDASADAVCQITPAPTAVGITSTAGEISNAAIVLHNTGDGEYGGGNASNTVIVILHYLEVTTTL